ncbi:MAG TPA: ATP-binding cassette domain-containing protein [Vicinamibacterales bacterium]|nr:ATP-binding cassette domain-containing protein [Vicinamibacterales bacterium]
MDPAVMLAGVTKTFGSQRAVDQLDLRIPRGALCGVIGPNGAGKTTTIRILMSILFPDSGQVSVLGHASALAAKDRIGYLPEERGVYRKMKVIDFLVYMAGLKAVPESQARPWLLKSLERLELTASAGKRCEELSRGMQQKVQFLASTLHRPDLLILDEPFSGLDPVSTRLLRQLVLEEHQRGATILFSTHVMSHAEDLCDTVVMIHRGRKVLDESVAAIRRKFDVRSLLFEPLDPQADTKSLRTLPGVDDVSSNEGQMRVALAPGTDPAAAIAAITAVIPTARIELARLRLEDVFIRLVDPTNQGSGAVTV